jgi:hypothetical protein
MKRQVLLMIIMGTLLWACATQKGVVRVEKSDEITANDSLEYELVTFDGKFESWYIMQNVPSRFRSQEYYENWNHQYVNAWNYNSTQSGKNNFFEYIHGYDPTIDYGFELNHKLFYYFQYVENVLKIKILPAGPKAVIF